MVPREFYPDPLDDEKVELVTIEDGYKWSKAVLEDLENANWHDAREALQPLIYLLPQVHEALTAFNRHGLAKRLEKSTEGWDRYF